MADLLTLEDVLREASTVGLELTERTFRYYTVLGLFPRPVKRPTADGRVHFYPPEILDRLREIKRLQTEGFSLKQIKARFGGPAPQPPPPEPPPREGALPLAARLRHLTLARLTEGESPDPQELERYRQSLQGLTQRLALLAKDPDAVVRTTSARLTQALQRLEDGLDYRDPEGAVAALHEAERAILQVDQFVRLYRQMEGAGP